MSVQRRRGLPVGPRTRCVIPFLPPVMRKEGAPLLLRAATVEAPPQLPAVQGEAGAGAGPSASATRSNRAVGRPAYGDRLISTDFRRKIPYGLPRGKDEGLRQDSGGRP